MSIKNYRFLNFMTGYEKFRKLCIEKNVKPIDVSRETGVSTATLSSWKSGKYKPKQDKLDKIASFFGVSSNYFNENYKKAVVYRAVTKHPPKFIGDINIDGNMVKIISAHSGTGKSSFARNIVQLTNHERKVLEAYRKYEHKEAIDAILGIGGDKNDD